MKEIISAHPGEPDPRRGKAGRAEFLGKVSPATERGLGVLVLDSQLSISREQVCVSSGNLLKSMLHIAVTVTLETKGRRASAPAGDSCEVMKQVEKAASCLRFRSGVLASGKPLKYYLFFMFNIRICTSECVSLLTPAHSCVVSQYSRVKDTHPHFSFK